MQRLPDLVAMCLFGAVLCAGGFTAGKGRAAQPRLPQDAIPVPVVRQVTDYSCGPAALVAVLQYFQVWSGTEDRLHRLLGTAAENGTLPEALANGARRFGLQSSVEQPMTLAQLKAALLAGRVVILELQAWRDPKSRYESWIDTWTDGHYVVLVGMDNQYAYFMDPSISDAYTYVPQQELLSRWHDINEQRGPRAQHDYHLGVVISAPASLTQRRGLSAQNRRTIQRLISLD